MKLTGKQTQEIREAILDAYGSVDDLRVMVRFELDEKLDEIAGGENLRVLVFNLITWAERSGRVDDLIQGAHRQNPGNQALQQQVQSWRSPPQSRSAIVEPDPLTSNPAQTGPVSIDVFLSYSRKDIAAMREVQETLGKAGLSVWTDDGLEPGTLNWQDAIEEAVHQARAMIVLLSPNAKQSPWVKNEIGFAQAQNKRTYPVLIAGDTASAVPISLISAQWVDGRENLHEAVFRDLLPALRRYTYLPSAAEPPHQEVATSGAEEQPKERAAAEQRIAVQDRQPVASEAIAMTHPKKNRYLLFGIIAVFAVIVGVFNLPRLQATVSPYLTANTTSTAAPTAAPTATPVVAITTRINPKDGAVYVYVPAGPFIMGSSDKDSLASDAEKPQMLDFNVDGFWIMQTEVTNAQYAKCVEAGACQEPDNMRWNDPTYAEHPVTHVDWHQANAYAQWAGGRLPSEAEWEKACRGTDGRLYPWGDEPPTQDLANFSGANVHDTAPVGSYPGGASPYGARNMAGNVMEWTATKGVSDYQNYKPDDEPEGDDWRTLRGGAWNSDDISVRCADRLEYNPDLGRNELGFRVLSLGG